MQRPPQLQATIPFSFGDLNSAITTQDRMMEVDLLKDTRGDWTQIVQAAPGDFHDNLWYVVIHTGNITGMIHDLRALGFM